VLGDRVFELRAIGLDGERLDLVQAAELGLEVVIERRRADADLLGDVRPLSVLVPVLTEVLDRRVNDVVALTARGTRTTLRSG
jgi:hypothetical protein